VQEAGNQKERKSSLFPTGIVMGSAGIWRSTDGFGEERVLGKHRSFEEGKKGTKVVEG
jgi:hypothetical protein